MTFSANPMTGSFKYLFVPVVSAALAAGGCRVLGSVDVNVFAWEGELVPVAGEAPHGTVAALTQNGRTFASIQVTDGPMGEHVFDWRIRAGSCAEPGAVLGGAATYPPIEHSAPGTTTSEAVFGDTMPDTRSYHAVLSRSEDGAELACADLQRV